MYDKDEWRVPPEIHSIEADYNIDKFIRSLPIGNRVVLSKRWTNNIQGAVYFGRRALEISIVRAQFASHDSIAHHHDWRRAYELASQAEQTLSKLLLFLSNGAEPSTASLNNSLFQYLVSCKGSDAREARQRSHSDAQMLMAAKDLICELAQFSDENRESLAANYQNQGNPAKTAFVEVFFEAWVALTGKLPSRSRTAGPFITFLLAAWEDIHGTDPHGGQDFSAAITNTHRRISDGNFHIDLNALPRWA